MSSEVARVLREAADLIEPPGRWAKGDLARDAAGKYVGPSDETAVCWCPVGAILRIASDLDEHQAACSTLARHVLHRNGSVAIWNDDQSGPEPVVAALRAAADEAERADA